MSEKRQVVRNHRYSRSPFSDAGNCWCGRHKAARLHRPKDGWRWLRFARASWRYRGRTS